MCRCCSLCPTPGASYDEIEGGMEGGQGALGSSGKTDKMGLIEVVKYINEGESDFKKA